MKITKERVIELMRSDTPGYIGTCEILATDDNQTDEIYRLFQKTDIGMIVPLTAVCKYDEITEEMIDTFRAFRLIANLKPFNPIRRIK